MAIAAVLHLQTAKVDEVRQAVYWAIEAGYRHIDTAAIYYDEPEVGQGIRDAINDGLVTREELFVTTKASREIVLFYTPEVPLLVNIKIPIFNHEFHF